MFRNDHLANLCTFLFPNETIPAKRWEYSKVKAELNTSFLLESKLHNNDQLTDIPSIMGNDGPLLYDPILNNNAFEH